MVILVLAIVFGLIFGNPDYLFSQIIVLSVIALLTAELIYFNRKVIREINRFLFALKNDDLTVFFSEKKLGPLFNDFMDSMQQYLTGLREKRIKENVSDKLLQAIIDQLDLGILAVNPLGEFLLINKTCTQTFGLSKSSNLRLLSKIQPGFVTEINYMTPGTRKLIDITHQKDAFQLLVYKQSIYILGQECDLITFYDIHNEIEQKEIEAWYKLIRILTHEIMNSVTPLTSLTDTVLMLLKDDNNAIKEPSKISDGNINDIIEATEMIRNRSKWILKFVDDYRKLTNIPAPEFQVISCKELFDKVVGLMKGRLSERKIMISSQLDDKNDRIKADSGLIELVFINLLTNSLYALEGREDPKIQIRSKAINNQLLIDVSDNGKGIPADRLDKIFIPFYSTREGGSGIGLSLSKQIVSLHHGRIKVQSKEGEGTSITILLPITPQSF